MLQRIEGKTVAQLVEASAEPAAQTTDIKTAKKNKQQKPAQLASNEDKNSNGEFINIDDFTKVRSEGGENYCCRGGRRRGQTA